MSESRRDFLKSIATSFLILHLCEISFIQKIVAAAVSPILSKWLKEMNELARSVKHDSISQLEWQKSMEALYHRVPLSDLLSFIDFERLALNTDLSHSGESFSALKFPKIEGMPEDTFFYKDMAGFRKGSSIPPHGHNHLVSSFLVLQGELHGRHFDRLQDEGSFLNIQPTIDKQFTKGQFSTVSQHKDNIHWFTALTDNAFIMDFGVGALEPTGTTKPLPHQDPLKSGRIYLDVERATKDSSGKTMRAERISEKSAYELYGAI